MTDKWKDQVIFLQYYCGNEENNYEFSVCMAPLHYILSCLLRHCLSRHKSQINYDKYPRIYTFVIGTTTNFSFYIH